MAVRKRTIYIDVDSTIWDLFPDQKYFAKKLYGIDLKEEQVDRWNWCYRVFGDDGFDIFRHILVPNRVQGRELYDGCAEALLDLYESGFDITFLSHHWNPKAMEPAVREWLQSKLEFPFSVTLMGARNDKIDYMMEDPSACTIIEDKPSTLKKGIESGIPVVAKMQRWNMDLIEKEDVLSFVEWDEAPHLLKNMILPTIQERLFA